MTSINSLRPGVYRFREVLVRRKVEAGIEVHPDLMEIYSRILDVGRAADGTYGCNGTRVANNDVLRLNFLSENDGSLEIGLAKSSYLMRSAFAQLAQERGWDFSDSVHAIGAMAYSPLIANASALSVVRDDKGSYCLVSHVRGMREVGTGALLSVLSAGHIDAKMLSLADTLPDAALFYDPFTATLDHEMRDEVGFTFSSLERTRFKYLVVEGKTGAVNVACVVRGISHDDVLASYEALTRRLLECGEVPEVGGIVFLPIERSSEGSDLESYIPTPNGLERNMISNDAPRRPYTFQVERFLETYANRKVLLEDAGF